jgi:hypothetical protein
LQEVSPNDTQWDSIEPTLESKECETNGVNLEWIGRRDPPAPELELPELEAVVGGAQRQVDPAPHPEPAAVGGLVGAGVVPARRAVAEHLHVPAPGLLEDGALLGEHLGVEPAADAGEVGRTRHGQLGVDVTDGGEEGVAQPGPVHGVVGALATLERAREPTRAHGVGPPQQVRGHAGEWLSLHPDQATDVV